MNIYQEELNGHGVKSCPAVRSLPRPTQEALAAVSLLVCVAIGAYLPEPHCDSGPVYFKYLLPNCCNIINQMPLCVPVL